VHKILKTIVTYPAVAFLHRLDLFGSFAWYVAGEGKFMRGVMPVSTYFGGLMFFSTSPPRQIIVKRQRSFIHPTITMGVRIHRTQ
jgi:hypothetical protein